MEEITQGLVPKPRVKKDLWRPEEDLLLIKYVEAHGEGNWATVSQRSGNLSLSFSLSLSTVSLSQHCNL